MTWPKLIECRFEACKRKEIVATEKKLRRNWIMIFHISLSVKLLRGVVQLGIIIFLPPAAKIQHNNYCYSELEEVEQMKLWQRNFLCQHLFCLLIFVTENCLPWSWLQLTLKSQKDWERRLSLVASSLVDVPFIRSHSDNTRVQVLTVINLDLIQLRGF